MDKHSKTSINYDTIYRTVRRIPKGRVATYGQIAELAGLGRQPRRVGYALSALREKDVPWHRVINAKGEISLRAVAGYESLQRELLQKEGIVFDQNDRVSLSKFCWRPKPETVSSHTGNSF